LPRRRIDPGAFNQGIAVIAEILIVLVLIVVNGVLAMSELAVVSARSIRLQAMADKGSSGARTAIELASDPGRFLSTVQIGITLVGVLSGAFSGATLGARFARILESMGLPENAAGMIGIGSVVVVITYLSLIVGELVPKQVALRNPEGIASAVAPFMHMLSRVAFPLVWLLEKSGDLVLWALRVPAKSANKVTDEEIKAVISEAAISGVLHNMEKDMIAGVMRLADRNAAAMMTPRRAVEFIDLSWEPSELVDTIRQTQRSHLPVQDGGTDAIIGVLQTRDVLPALAELDADAIRKSIRQPTIVAPSTGAITVLHHLRSSPAKMVLVFDEYGHFEGIVTFGNVLETITGDIADEPDEEPDFVRRKDGSYLVSGFMPIDEFVERLGIPIELGGDYRTVAGFVLHAMKHLPKAGETFDHSGWQFEVVDLDGRRIDKVLVAKSPEPER
jgi:putative hemolysin